MIETLIYVATGLIAVAFPVLYILRQRKKSEHAAHTLKKAIERGLDEPVSLHPLIDPAICIGSGACVKSCPELDVLGLIQEKGELISPARCIGHGQCAAACPVDAITLVFGTAKRGVDIPHLKGTYETNVPGLYIAGELGGMGLIRNAVRQGKQAAENIVASAKANPRGNALDLVVIGAGPAGFSASLQAKKDGLEFVTMDQEDLGGAVITYPRRKLVMTEPMELPLYGMVKYKHVEKEVLAELFSSVAKQAGLDVRAQEKVNDIQRVDGRFRVISTKGEYEANHVLLAIGRRGSPRKIGCPGEQSGKVTYRLLEPEKFHDMRILVVGGGDSAVEAAIALAEQPGNTVHLSYRGENVFRIKDLNRERLATAIQAGRVNPLFNSTVNEITPTRVTLTQGDHDVALDNDQVFVFIGGELPTEFLNRVGIEFTRKHGER
jgi:thioredoxin reductase (NADPH)